MYFGYKIPTQDDGTGEQRPVILYEDGYLTFNHPTLNNLGASHETLKEADGTQDEAISKDGQLKTPRNPYDQYF